MSLSKNLRLSIYEKLIEVLNHEIEINDYRYTGYCYCFLQLAWDIPFESVKINIDHEDNYIHNDGYSIEDLPELMELKPNEYLTFWFPTDLAGVKLRVTLLEEIIEKLKINE